MIRRSTFFALALAGCTPDASPPDAALARDATTADARVDDASAQPAGDVTDEGAAIVPDAMGADGGVTDATTPFTLTSTAFVAGGTLPAEFTCDGVGHSPPLSWSAPPPGTVEFAVMMTTLARDGLKWNWVLHSLPGSTRELSTGTAGVGVAGLTSDGPMLAYSPPCSRGPGPMQYTFTVYALSAHPALPAQPRDVTGAVLTEAIRTITLGTAAATVTYTR